MHTRTLPPFALFDYWGIDRKGTIGECTKHLRQRYETAVSQKDLIREYVYNPENFRTFRLANCMSRRYVAKTLKKRRDRIKRIEKGGNTTFHFLRILLSFYNAPQDSLLEEHTLLKMLVTGAFSELQAAIEEDDHCRDIFRKTFGEDVFRVLENKERDAFTLPLYQCSMEEAIGHNLRWLRKRLGISIIEAAVRSGVSVETIALLESANGSDVKLSALQMLGDLYGEPRPVMLLRRDYCFSVQHTATDLEQYHTNRSKKLIARINLCLDVAKKAVQAWENAGENAASEAK